MIRGVGVDIIEIDRIRRSTAEFGPRFLEKIFTPGEIAYCSAKSNPHQHYAARFAAKEALSKALATGWAGEFRWHHVEVTNLPSGAPRIRLTGPLRSKIGQAQLHVSLSHSDSHVVAVVVIEELTS
jgi:holo-[acyl-carrier protein] synthase